MRVTVIGGKGHVGTYLVPRLVESGHAVVNVSRGQSRPYLPHSAWQSVTQVDMDREAEEAAGTFGKRIAESEPDVVIDMICFTLESARQLVEALEGKVRHFLSCGSIWVHGYAAVVPTTEDQTRRPFGEYGIQKAAIEDFLLDRARRRGFPATVLHPGHIVGPGHVPVSPLANKNPGVYEKLRQNEEIVLPNFGLETVHHVHADDVAQAFVKAINDWHDAAGESFHVVSPAALTLRGYAEAVAAWFGHDARLRFLPWEDWRGAVDLNEQDIGQTHDHIAHSPCISIAKARRLLGYEPRYTSLRAVFEALGWLIEHGKLGDPKLGQGSPA